MEAINEMVGRPDYPCLGARSVFRRDRATVRVYDELDAPATAPLLLQDLQEFASGVDLDEGFASFIAIFRGPRISDERHFERLLWSQLRRLHAAGRGSRGATRFRRIPTTRTSPSASPAPPTSSWACIPWPRGTRGARRSPTLVFNLHEQFEALRASGQFPRMRDRIRHRDEQLQGTINPMVADHGEISAGPAVLRPGGRVRLAGPLRRAEQERDEDGWRPRRAPALCCRRDRPSPSSTPPVAR